MKIYKIDKSKCVGCGTCNNFCPHQAIEFDEDGKASVNQEKCRHCGLCFEACPYDAVKVEYE